MGNERENIYFQLYNQRGGDFPVFQGARHSQYGNGFGDVLWGFLRHVLPVAVKGAASFLGSLMQKRNEGQNWGNAAKSALIPAAGTVLNETANKIRQGGSGKRRKNKRKRNVFIVQHYIRGSGKGTRGDIAIILKKGTHYQNQ